jgi:hypothetical protein
MIIKKEKEEEEEKEERSTASPMLLDPHVSQSLSTRSISDFITLA